LPLIVWVYLHSYFTAVLPKAHVYCKKCIMAVEGQFKIIQIRRSVPPDTFQSLIVSLVISRLDYGNAVLVSLPVYLVRSLQSVLNAAARLPHDIR